jgi:hypothetical protein
MDKLRFTSARRSECIPAGLRRQAASIVGLLLKGISPPALLNLNLHQNQYHSSVGTQ